MRLGELQRQHDYIDKRRQYEEIGVPESWVVDPILGTVTVFFMQSGTYGKPMIRQGQDDLASPAQGNLNLTV
uniref:Uma2 family endonuclease n=1 Tax=Petrachloros mirabilis TaxID=2918835 RepID=UPI0030842DEB